MTVKELIDYLKELPEGYKVRVYREMFQNDYPMDEDDIDIDHEHKEVTIT